jgi:hypothetical protein
MTLTLTRGASMPVQPITPADHADALTQIRDAARTARTALGRLSLEGWLAVACVFVVMWAIGWL